MKSAVSIDRETGEITIQAKDQAYRFALNTTAMIALEDEYSTPEKECSFEEAFNRIQNGRVRGIRKLLWFMSREFHPDLTEEDINPIIDSAGGVLGLAAALDAARQSASPDPKDTQALGLNGKGANPRKAQSGKATRSGGESSTSAPAPAA